jgi:hypothetical protein
MQDQANKTPDNKPTDVKPVQSPSDKTIPIHAETPKAPEAVPEVSKTPDTEKERKQA